MGITEFVIAFALAISDDSGTAAISWVSKHVLPGAMPGRGLIYFLNTFFYSAASCCA
jgi:hypothetical protein